MNTAVTIKRSRGTRWCIIGSWLLLTGVVLVTIGLAGSRLEFLTPVMSFTLFGIGFLITIVSGLTTAIGIAISMGTAGDASALRSWGALTISVIIIGTVMSQRPDTAVSAPIHDITTDTVNPPQFEAILPLRANAQNPPEYAGADTASQQLSAYPDIKTLTIKKPADVVYTAAEQAASKLGWDIVAADPATGRIEATDTTAWFHFKDDIVIRLTPHDLDTIVDVRSKSRVGRSDMGANAARIRAFLKLLEVHSAK